MADISATINGRVMTSDESCSIRIELVFNLDDPYAVHLLIPDGEVTVDWIISIELFTQALEMPDTSVGDCDAGDVSTELIRGLWRRRSAKFLIALHPRTEEETKAVCVCLPASEVAQFIALALDASTERVKDDAFGVFFKKLEAFLAEW